MRRLLAVVALLFAVAPAPSARDTVSGSAGDITFAQIGEEILPIVLRTVDGRVHGQMLQAPLKLLPPLVITDDDCRWIEKSFDEVKARRQAAIGVHVKEAVGKRPVESFARCRQILGELALGSEQQFDARAQFAVWAIADGMLEMNGGLRRGLGVEFAFEEQLLPI